MSKLNIDNFDRECLHIADLAETFDESIERLTAANGDARLLEIYRKGAANAHQLSEVFYRLAELVRVVETPQPPPPDR